MALFGIHPYNRGFSIYWCVLVVYYGGIVALPCSSRYHSNFLLFLSTMIQTEWFVFHPVLEFVTLFYGVFLGWYGIRDIWDDTISRTVEGSDADACYKMWPCCLPRCVGIQFALLALGCQALGLYFALVSLVGNNTR